MPSLGSVQVLAPEPAHQRLRERVAVRALATSEGGRREIVVRDGIDQELEGDRRRPGRAPSGDDGREVAARAVAGNRDAARRRSPSATALSGDPLGTV